MFSAYIAYTTRVSFHWFVRITGINNISNTIKFKTFLMHRLFGEKMFVKYVVKLSKIIRKFFHNVLRSEGKSSDFDGSKVLDCQGVNWITTYLVAG